jgi:hypothetical protein
MADKKITQLTDLGTAIASDTLFNVVTNPSTTPINNKVSTSNIFNNIPTYIGLKQTAETLTSTTEADNTKAITLVNADAGDVNVSLANGTDGQIKIFADISTFPGTAHDVIITPVNALGFSQVTFSNTGTSLTLLFKNSKWIIISNNGGAIA